MRMCSQNLNILYDIPLSVDVSGPSHQSIHFFIPLLRKIHKINRHSGGLCVSVGAICSLNEWISIKISTGVIN